jgi:hypothetical protein
MEGCGLIKINIMERPNRKKYYGKSYNTLIADLELYIDYLEAKIEQSSITAVVQVCDCVIPKPIDAYHPIDKEICRDCNGKIANDS